MFSHIGKSRTPRHNLALASLLSLVAGLVNVVGFFAVHQLTTNVTGHFAFFIEEVFLLQSHAALYFALFVLAFFGGAFLANFMVETWSRIRENETYVLPILLEAIILICVAIFGNDLIRNNPDVVAVLLLFAMGMQNSFVTSISRSVVRTTHLTGLFTDMGIEFSQLFFYKTKKQKDKLLGSIKLRLTIIVMFFLGGIFGAILYKTFGIKTLFFGAGLLLAGLLFDYLKIRVLLLKRNRL